jgi:hypothetical protein
LGISSRDIYREINGFSYFSLHLYWKKIIIQKDIVKYHYLFVKNIYITSFLTQNWTRNYDSYDIFLNGLVIKVFHIVSAPCSCLVNSFQSRSVTVKFVLILVIWYLQIIKEYDMGTGLSRMILLYQQHGKLDNFTINLLFLEHK